MSRHAPKPKESPFCQGTASMWPGSIASQQEVYLPCNAVENHWMRASALPAPYRVININLVAGGDTIEKLQAKTSCCAMLCLPSSFFGFNTSEMLAEKQLQWISLLSGAAVTKSFSSSFFIEGPDDRWHWVSETQTKTCCGEPCEIKWYIMQFTAIITSNVQWYWLFEHNMPWNG